MHRTLRILLVDDEPAVLDLCSEVLRSAGYDVVAARDGQQALALLKDGQAFDVLVTDHTMPGLSGTALLTRATLLRPSLGCLLMTGDPEPADADGVAILLKPFRAAALLGAVEDLIAELGRGQQAAERNLG